MIDQNEFFDKRIASKDVRGYYLIKKGEFAYNKSTSVDAPLGAIKRLDKYKNGVLSTLYILFKIIDDTSTSSDYLVTYYSTDLWHKGIRSIATEGARNHGLLNIAPNDFLETMLSIPLNVSEQKKVGDFFIFLDHLITLHQSKSLGDILKTVASRTLYWEQRKLGEIVDVCNGRDYKHLLEGDIPVYGTGGYMISVNKALSYDRDAIGIGRKGTIDKPYILNAPFWTVDTLFYVIPKDKIALIFAFGIFQNIDWEKKDESTGVPSLSKAAINEIDVLIPKYEEQKVLGLFFNGLDHLITLHQLEPFQLIFKAIAYRIIDYAKSKPPRYIKYEDII
nr:restriction endonuclease subunit S [uncultured Lachnoanaerobaculum sp.]